MATVLHTPSVDELGRVVAALREWQREGAELQLHPGDLGWFWRFGAQATARALRTWSRDGEILAVGLLDGPELLRLAIVPEAHHDKELAQAIAVDASEPRRGVLTYPSAGVEAPRGAVVRDILAARGWTEDEPRSQLRCDLTEPVPDSGNPVEVIAPDRAPVRVAVQRASFERSTFTTERWRDMSRGLPYTCAMCLVAHDAAGAPVAAVTVWSAGPGRPGLLEPMGVHREHRRRGYGRAITAAAIAALQELGASSALVCTARTNVPAVSTYLAAGFHLLAEVPDLRRGSRRPGITG